MQALFLAYVLVIATPFDLPQAAGGRPPAAAAIASGDAKRVSDAEIRRRMIAESIESYPGNCACPYQRASNGSSCGRRSAYNRGGGYAPLCYASDISDAMVRSYRAEMGLD